MGPIHPSPLPLGPHPLHHLPNAQSKVSPGHPWIGKEVRGISEKHIRVFERPGKIHDVLLDGKIEWKPDGFFLTWTSDLYDLEFTPARIPKGKLKTGKSSQADLKEVHMRIPDLKEKLKPDECLNSHHLVLGDWMIHRDVRRDFPGDPQRLPELVLPEVITGLLGADPEIVEQCQNVVRGHMKRCGLLGIPIHAGDHWTLLVCQRNGGREFKLHEEEFLKIRYYDSIQTFSKTCWDVAWKVIRFIAPKMNPEKIADIHRCGTYQRDPISCGLYVLHYWEGEVRQFVGQGWSVGRPESKLIHQRRQRIIVISKELEDFIKADVMKIGKAKKMKKDTKEILEFPQEGPRAPAAEDHLKFLKDEATRSLLVALVPFYGCPRCRHGRGGCIDWKCNPAKFNAHLAEFPERYEGKFLRPASWKDISMSQLLGGS